MTREARFRDFAAAPERDRPFSDRQPTGERARIAAVCSFDRRVRADPDPDIHAVAAASRNRAFVLILHFASVLAFLVAGCSPDRVARNVTASDVKGEIPAPPAPVTKSVAEPDKVLSSAPPSAPRLAVEGEGLRWFLQPSGSARAVPFGRPQDEVMASLEPLRGLAVKGTNQDCGAGPVQYATWRDGLSLVFQGNRFVGWSLDGRAEDVIATAAGVGPGTTRAELQSAYSATISKTSLGYEFSTGDLHGVLDGASVRARVTDMWAGVSCVGR